MWRVPKWTLVPRYSFWAWTPQSLELSFLPEPRGSCVGFQRGQVTGPSLLLLPFQLREAQPHRPAAMSVCLEPGQSVPEPGWVGGQRSLSQNMGLHLEKMPLVVRGRGPACWATETSKTKHVCLPANRPMLDMETRELRPREMG